MSRFTSISATNATIDNLTVGLIQSPTVNGVQVLSDVNLNGQSVMNANKVAFTTYELVEDYTAKTLAVHILGTRFKGALYDATLNKPYEQVLPLSQTYTLPGDIITLKNDIVTNPYKIFVIQPTENTTVDLPALTASNVYQNTHVRFSNDTNFLVSFLYNGTPIIQIGYERVSFVWRTTNGTDYEWVYVP
jgi:hypothetical protein